MSAARPCRDLGGGRWRLAGTASFARRPFPAQDAVCSADGASAPCVRADASRAGRAGTCARRRRQAGVLQLVILGGTELSVGAAGPETVGHWLSREMGAGAAATRGPQTLEQVPTAQSGCGRPLRPALAPSVPAPPPGSVRPSQSATSPIGRQRRLGAAALPTSWVPAGATRLVSGTCTPRLVRSPRPGPRGASRVSGSDGGSDGESDSTRPAAGRAPPPPRGVPVKRGPQRPPPSGHASLCAAPAARRRRVAFGAVRGGGEVGCSVSSQ